MKHLTVRERGIIWHMQAFDYSMRQIARSIGKSHTTVSRELRRNANECELWQDRAVKAEELTQRRISTANSHPKISEEAKAFIVDQVDRLRTSPSIIETIPCYHQISGSVKKDAIYRFLKAERLELLTKLPGSKRRKKRAGKRKPLPKREEPKVSIELRPQNQQKQLGFIQGDTMHGKKGSQVLATLIDQESHLIKLKRMLSTDADSFHDACLTLIPSFKKATSLLLDNGPETYCYPELKKDLKLEIYFCHPLAAWEKGCLENRIGVIRLFIPKGTDIALLTDQQIAHFEFLVNSRPLRILGGLSPLEYQNKLLA